MSAGRKPVTTVRVVTGRLAACAGFSARGCGVLCVALGVLSAFTTAALLFVAPRSSLCGLVASVRPSLSEFPLHTHVCWWSPLFGVPVGSAALFTELACLLAELGSRRAVDAATAAVPAGEYRRRVFVWCAVRFFAALLWLGELD